MSEDQTIHVRAYLPADRQHALAQRRPLPDTAPGAVLSVHIAGVVRYVESAIETLGAQQGAQQIAAEIDTAFEIVTAPVQRYHGHIINIADGSMLCFFPADDGRRAVAAAQLIRQSVKQHPPLKTLDREHVLSSKSVVTVGDIKRYQVGDPEIQCFELMLGDATVRNMRIASQLENGEILIGSEVAAALGRLLQCELASEAPGHVVYRVQRLIATVPVEEPASPPPQAEAQDYAPWLLAALREHLLDPEAHRLSECRTVTTLFLRFSFRYTPSEVSEQQQLDEFMRAVQKLLAQHGGWALKLVYSEHGLVLCAVFGAPDQAGNPAESATSCAFKLREICDQHPAIDSSHLGLGHGGAWAGAYGSEQRRQYGVLGRQARLAERLMQRATAGQMLLTDDLARLTRRSLRLRPCGHIQFQGEQQSSPVHQAEARLSVSARRDAMRCEGSLIGREDERRSLLGLLDEFAAGNHGQVLILEGESGIGKTRLLESFIEMAQMRGISTAFTAAEPVQELIPYFAWRGLLEELAGTETGQTGRLRLWLEQCLTELPDHLPYASLLNDVVPLGIADSAEVRVLTPEGRADRLQSLLVSIVNLASARTPTVLVLDDTHWMDTSSWRLLLALFASPTPLIAVLAQRPPEPTDADAFARLQPLPHCQRRRLAPLAGTEAAALLNERLGDIEIGPDLQTGLLARAQGNPLFIEVLCAASVALRKRRPDDALGLCALNELPETPEAAIEARIDALTPAQQNFLMAASIVGRVVDAALLRAAFPDLLQQAAEPTDLRALSEVGFTTTRLEGIGVMYFFRHAITQQAAYARLSTTERCAGHRAVAEWLQERGAAQPEDHQAALAHHRLAAGDEQAGIEHLGHAATHAQSIGAFSESSRLYGELLARCASTNAALSTHKRAGWHAQLARALLAVGDLNQSQARAETGLVLLATAVPQNPIMIRWQLLCETLKQWLSRHRLMPRKSPEAAQSEKFRLRSQLCEHLEEIYLFKEQLPQARLASLLTVNGLESGGDVKTALVRAYSGLMLSAQINRKTQLCAYYEGAACKASLDLVAQPEHTATLALLKNRSALLRIGEGHLSEAKLDNDTSIEAAEKSGAQITHLQALVQRCVLSILRGQFTEGLRHAEHYEASAKRFLVGHTQAEVRLATLHLRALCLLQTDHLAAAELLLTELAEVLSTTANPARLSIWHEHLKAELAMHQGDLSGARQNADALFGLLAKTPPRVCYRLGPYATPAEVLIREAEDNPTTQPAVGGIRRRIQLFREFQRTFRLGAPRLSLLEGRFDLLLNRIDQGRAALHQSAHQALDMDLPIDQAMAELGLARSWPAGSLERREHALTAAAIFSHLKVSAEAKRVANLLAE